MKNMLPTPAENRRKKQPAGKNAAHRGVALLLCLLFLLTLPGCGLFSRDNPDPVRFSGAPGMQQIQSFFETLNQRFSTLFEDEDLLYYSKGGDQADGGYTNGGGFTNGDKGNRVTKGSNAGKDSHTSKDGWQNGLAPQGSAKFLEGNVVLVSIYVIDGQADYSEKELAYTRDALDMAAGWMESQAAKNDVDLNVICNQPELTFRWQADGLLKEAQKDVSYTYSDDVGSYLYHFDLAALREKYDTESIGFVVFLPGEGTSFAYPYTATGNVKWDAVSYYEFSNLFLYDESAPDEYENPATYAHEILHLFGACDLYEENKTDHISQELSDYITDNYPDEIMYYTYEADDTSNFEEITKDMSPVTLYFIGWGDGGAEIKQFPEIKRKYPCAFE